MTAVFTVVSFSLGPWLLLEQDPVCLGLSTDRPEAKAVTVWTVRVMSDLVISAVTITESRI